MPDILIVDDLEDNISLITDALKSHMPEARTYQALDGSRGIEIAREVGDELDLIILDANMPGIDGFEVCATLKSGERITHAPILMLSAVFVDAGDRVRGMNSGADSYLCKPYHIEELIAQVKVLLRIKENEDALRKHQQSLTEELNQRTGTLRQTEERLQNLFEASPDAIYVVGADGAIFEVNPAACRLHDMPQEQILGGGFLGLVSPAHRTSMEKAMMTWLDREVHQDEGKLVQSGGTIIPVEIRTKRIRYGERDALLLHIRDLTERKMIEEQIRATQKMDAVGRLAGGIAHDFNNLLTSILGYSHLIKESADDSPALKKDVEQIIHSADRAANLTRQLLVFGRRQFLPLHAVNLNTVVTDVDQLLRRTLGEHIEQVTLLGEDIGVIKSDEGQIEQIILNLAINARDAMPDNGKLVIETMKKVLVEDDARKHVQAKPGEYVVLAIGDSGTGMAKDVADRIYEPFFSTKSKEQGRGLGLSTVYGIVNHSGGFIELDTEPGEGTRFQIYFPVIELDIEIPKKTGVDLPTGTETILLVEDEELVLQLTRRILESLGYKVHEARNGSEALRVAEEHGPFDLLVSDVIMPHMGGPELVRKLRAKGQSVRVLFISGFTDDTLSLDELEEEETDLLLKPYVKEELANRVRTLLDA